MVIELEPDRGFHEMPPAQVRAWRRWGAMHRVPIEDQLLGHPLVINEERHTITLTVFDREARGPVSRMFQLEAGPLPLPEELR